jgi:hypothetical protein
MSDVGCTDRQSTGTTKYKTQNKNSELQTNWLRPESYHDISVVQLVGLSVYRLQYPCYELPCKDEVEQN